MHIAQNNGYGSNIIVKLNTNVKQIFQTSQSDKHEPQPRETCTICIFHKPQITEGNTNVRIILQRSPSLVVCDLETFSTKRPRPVLVCSAT